MVLRKTLASLFHHVRSINLTQRELNSVIEKLLSRERWVMISVSREVFRAKGKVAILEEIVFSKVKIRFSDGSEPIPCLSLKLSRGNLCTIKGISGSGKTTLLNLMVGELIPYRGEIIWRLSGIGDVKLSSGDSRAVKALIRTHVTPYIGYQHQKPLIVPYYTVRENIELGNLKGSDRGKVACKLEYLIDRLELRADKLGKELSWGERIRLALARAIYGSRHFILLDEPTASLDERRIKAIFDLLSDILEGKFFNGFVPAVVIATHDPRVISWAKSFSKTEYEVKISELLKVTCIDML